MTCHEAVKLVPVSVTCITIITNLVTNDVRLFDAKEMCESWAKEMQRTNKHEFKHKYPLVNGSRYAIVCDWRVVCSQRRLLCIKIYHGISNGRDIFITIGIKHKINNQSNVTLHFLSGVRVRPSGSGGAGFRAALLFQ